MKDVATSSTLKRGRQTTVALKVLMALTGLFFVFFVLFHMYGNLKMLLGAESYNYYAHWLREDMLYPILPHGGGLFLFRLALAGSLVIHVACALILWHRAGVARGSKYKVNKGVKKNQSYASKTMRFGGVFLLVFIVFHILQFTTLHINVGGDYKTMEPFERLIVTFQPENWWVYLFYFLAMGALAMHVRHGVFSALATLGLDTRERELGFNVVAWLCAIALFVGFMLPPTMILVGVIS